MELQRKGFPMGCERAGNARGDWKPAMAREDRRRRGRGTAVALILAVAMCGGCAIQPATDEPPEANLIVHLDEPTRRIIEDSVRSQLKDPGSATFRNINASSTDRSGTSACGLVNAKNSYGGYTGDQPFIGLLMERTKGRKDWAFIPAKIAGTTTEIAVVQSICSKKGIDPQNPPIIPKR